MMTPEPGERLLRFVGDRVRFVLRAAPGEPPARGWRARLRTNLGRAGRLRREIIEAHTHGLPLAGESWRDLPMHEGPGGWFLDLPLAEIGYFKAKAYLLDPKGWQHWPEGADVGIAVHPDACRTANIIYCAFPRMFGPGRAAANTVNPRLEQQIQQIEQHGYSIIPPSGKLRDLIECLPHIVDELGCRILHLLPVNPVPATYARFGRFGSPYAALDLTAVDPALVVFDRRTTGVDQFRELMYATHLRGARVMLDIVINHTGWGSMLQENHPGWFVRNPDGTFANPGAWGVIWEDLVELKHGDVALWDKLADMFLTWCRRGVDGFRCDAGYKVPVTAWQYIVARVQEEYPLTIFLLEGLGGAWEATDALLAEGGMQWAYSELFQNYSGAQVATYLDHSLRQSERAGLLVHYSETHDNERLAVRGRGWSLLRNRLCGLASVSGGFGFTCGVEWLATQKIDVHGSTGMAWNQPDNLVGELAQLNRLIADHPCFFDGARLMRLSPEQSPVYALLRQSAEGLDWALVIVNTDIESERALMLPLTAQARDPESGVPLTWTVDLLGQALPEIRMAAGETSITVPAGGAYCLSPTPHPRGLSGEAYRIARAQAAWAIQALSGHFSERELGPCDWRALAQWVERSPFQFLAAIRRLDAAKAGANLQATLEEAIGQNAFPNIIRWSLIDRRRITPVPPDHWLLVEDTVRFRASLQCGPGTMVENLESIPWRHGHVACFRPRGHAADARLSVERYGGEDREVEGSVQFLSAAPAGGPEEQRSPDPDGLVLLTNGIGGMARICIDLGRVQSKYDCVLAANLHPALPVDRHVFAKRIRVWVNADGFISPLNLQNLELFQPGPPAIWKFVANAGDGRTVEIEMRADMLEGRNTTVFHFSRPTAALAGGRQLPAGADVRLTVRIDIEDRSFHCETRRNAGAEFHFGTHTTALTGSPGFAFAPAGDRQLRVFVPSDAVFPPGQIPGVEGVVENCPAYHSQPEWSEGIPHPIEQSRGQTGSGDAYSPGWFELPLPKGGQTALVVTADSENPGREEVESSRIRVATPGAVAAFPPEDAFGRQLLRAARSFVVRRSAGKTVIAGYPWFLDWGRDTLICARGLLAAGRTGDVKEILLTFARFEQQGTLPNTIHGADASNRDTSDAPLWFGVVCEELAAAGAESADFYSTRVDESGRTIRDVLWSIGVHYAEGTPNGIRMDPDSALIWSPAHFTWMDTNYPAATAREGYPIEIQALWIRLLRQLEKMGGTDQGRWARLAERAADSLEERFWLEARGCYADLLIAGPGQSAAQAIVCDAVRSNQLFAVSLGLAGGDRAQRSVEVAARYLVVPGALRSLAPLPVSVPLPVYGNDGRLLNDPDRPYWSRYEGDEDTRRKPAYHNGTAWTWTFPVFCEALARAWDFAPETTAAARAYLGSMDRLLWQNCVGQIPEVLDGDCPHRQRGCDAQAWGVTEALRVWRLLRR